MDALEILNGAMCGAIALALVWAILHPRVDDGIVIKAGLILMATGFGALALRIVGNLSPDSISAFERALLLVNGGVAVVIVGYLVRKRREGRKLRRSTDWADLDEGLRWPVVGGKEGTTNGP